MKLSGNIHKIKWTNIVVLAEIFETDTLVINETQMTSEKKIGDEFIEDQMKNSIESLTIANKSV